MHRFCAAVRNFILHIIVVGIARGITWIYANICPHCASTSLIEIKGDKLFPFSTQPALCLMVSSHFSSTFEARLTTLLRAAAMVVEDADPRFATATSATPSPEKQEPQEAASGDELFWRFWWCRPCRSCMLDFEAITSAEVNANLEGWQHLVEGQTDVAVEDFTRAIALGQGLAVAYNNRGIAHEVLEQMVEAQADYSEADRLAEKDLELRQRLQSVRVRKPISWKGRKEPAAATEAEGTDFLISFCNLDHKESNRRLGQLEEGVFFQGQCRCWAENLRISLHKSGF